MPDEVNRNNNNTKLRQQPKKIRFLQRRKKALNEQLRAAQKQQDSNLQSIANVMDQSYAKRIYLCEFHRDTLVKLA